MAFIILPAWAWPIAVIISLVSIIIVVIKCCRECRNDQDKRQVDPQSLMSVNQPQRIIVYTRVRGRDETNPQGNVRVEEKPQFEDKATTEEKPSAQEAVGIESNTDTRSERRIRRFPAFT